MRIDSINMANQIAFNGLWEKTYERSAGSEGHYNNIRMENCYHPFDKELGHSIISAVKSKTYQVLVPTENEYEFNNVISQPKIGKKLSFTKEQFNEYKRFYDKNMSESIKNIEKELIENNLGHYLNNKNIMAIKRFLHKIRII